MMQRPRVKGSVGAGKGAARERAGDAYPKLTGVGSRQAQGTAKESSRESGLERIGSGWEADMGTMCANNSRNPLFFPCGARNHGATRFRLDAATGPR